MDGSLRLRLTGAPLWAQLYVVRIMPLMVFALLGVLLAELPRDAPWWIAPGLALVAGLCLYWLSQPIILGSSISANSIEVRTNHLLGNRTRRQDLAWVRSIEMLAQPRPRGGRVAYRLILKDGHPVDFAHFAVGLTLDEVTFDARSRLFQEITGLPLTTTRD